MPTPEQGQGDGGQPTGLTRRDLVRAARDAALAIIGIGVAIGLSDLWALLTANHDIENNGYPLDEVLVGNTVIKLDQINIRTDPSIPDPHSGGNTVGYGQIQGSDNKSTIKISNALVIRGSGANPDGSDNPNLWLVLPRVGGDFLYIAFDAETASYIDASKASATIITNISTSDRKHETVTLANGRVLNASQLSVVTPA